MPDTTLRSRLRSAVRWPLVGILAGLMAGAVYWWMTGPDAQADFDPAARETSASAKRSATESPAPLAAPDQMAPSPAREAPLRPSAERHGAAASVEFDGAHPLCGRVIPDFPLPHDESLEVVVEAWSRGTPGLKNAPDDGHAWKEVARVDVLADGTFEARRPKNVSTIRLRAVGDYVHGGEVTFDVEGENDPGMSWLEVPAKVGAHVTLELDFAGMASPSEIASLAGDVLAFSSIGPTGYVMSNNGRAYGTSAVLGSDGQAVLRGVIPFNWRVSQTGHSSKDQALAPFRIQSGFHFEPARGERVTLTVPMERGLRFEGYVEDEEGGPIERAGIEIVKRWPSTWTHGPRTSYRSSDSDGHFLFQALTKSPDSLWIIADGFLGFHLGPDELAALLEAPGPHRIVLMRGGELAVKAKVQCGLPASGIPVTITSATSHQTQTKKTDAEGIASFHGLPAGDFTLKALGRRRAQLQREPRDPVRFLPVDLNSSRGPLHGTNTKEETLWAAAIDVAASTLDAGGVLLLDLAPVPMVRAQVVGANPSWSAPLLVAVHSLSPGAGFLGRLPAHEGTFPLDPATGRFEGQLPPGRYRAAATSGKHPSGPITAGSPTLRTSIAVEFEVRDEDIELELLFGTPLGLEGVTTLPDGTPIPNIEVLLSQRESHWSRPKEAERSDQRGLFAFDELEAGDYSLGVSSSKFVTESPTEVTLGEGRATPSVEVVAVRAGAVRVTVLDRQGMPHTAGRTRILKPDGHQTWARAITDIPGWNRAVGPLRPGEYLAIWDQELAGGSVRLLRERVTIKAGEVTEVVLTQPLEGTSILTGQVTTGGAPAPEVNVWLFDDLGLAGNGITDDQGRYTIDCIASGSATIRIGRNRFSSLPERSVELGAGPTSAPTVELPSGTIEGRLIDDLRSIGQGEVVVGIAGADPSEPPFRWSGTSTGGHFRIQYLPDGRYEVYLHERGGGRSKEWGSQIIEIKNGERVRGIEIAKHR